MAYSYSIDDPAKNSKRMAAFALVVIIHVLFVYVLASGLGKKVVEVVLGPVETRLIEELPDEDEEPPPPPPEIDTPPPYVPPPEISIDIPVDTGPTTAISNVTQRAPGGRAAAGRCAEAGRARRRQDAAVHAGPRCAHHASPSTRPRRAAPARRARSRSRCSCSRAAAPARCEVAKSSGFPKLDEAAVKEVQRNWRFVPGKEDGKPVSMWHTFAVTFRLTD